MVKIINSKRYKKLRSKLRQEVTPPEDRLWQELRKSQLGYKFRRQQSIDRFIVDFYCPELKLVIEVDGQCHDGDEAFEYDKKRQEYLENLGLKVVRYNTQEIFRNLEGVVRDIKEVCDKLSGKIRVRWE